MASIAAAEQELATAVAAAAETVDAEGKALSKSESKKRKKMVQKYEKKVAKEKAKAAKAAANPNKAKGGKKVEVEADPVEPWKYFENRSKQFAGMEEQFEKGDRKNALLNPYPHKFNVDMSLPIFRSTFDAKLKDGEHDSATVLSVAGRVMAIRGAGKLVFFVLQGDGCNLQIMSSARDYGEGMDAFSAIHKLVRRGDIIGCTGNPGKYSKRRRSNVAVITVRVIFISVFLFYCLLLNHSFSTNPNRITNCFKLILSLATYN